MQTNVALVDTKGLSHDEWLKERRRGIGGSDAAPIMGVSKYKTPLSVYLDKLGLAPETEVNEAMRQGTDLEFYVADRFCEETGLKVRRCNRILQHPEYPWMLANIDRDVIGEDSGLECKTTSPLSHYDFEGGEIPVHYMWQSMHYMAVTGAKSWYIAVLVFSKGFYVYKLERDEELISKLIECEKRFWEENVMKEVPPLPTGSEDDIEAIKYLYPTVSNDEIVELSELKNDLDVLEYQKNAKAEIEKKISEIEGNIKLKMKDSSLGLAKGWRVTWKQSDRTSLDTKRLKAEHPEVYAMYSTAKPTRTFRVSKIKEEN